MANPSLVFYYKQTPFYLKINNYFTVGYIDSNGVLTDITTSNNLIITVLESNANITRNINGYNILSLNSINTMESVYLKLTYNLVIPNIVLYQSVALVQPFLNIKSTNLLNSYQQLLPNIYTNNTKSIQGNESNSLMEQLYAFYNNSNITITNAENENVQNASFSDLQTIRNNMFPENGSVNWEILLKGTNNLSNSYQYGQLLRLLYQLSINCNSNAYYFAKNISAYIYYRLGVKYYCLLNQYTNEYLNNFILNNNSLSQCYLTNNSNTVNARAFEVYILYADNADLLPQFSNAFKAELNNFIISITPSALKVTIYYDYTLNDVISEFGLSYLGQIYLTDPNRGRSTCILYNQYSLSETLGYGGNEGNIGSINDFTPILSPIATIYKDISILTIIINVSANTNYTLILDPIYTILPSSLILNNLNNYAQFYSDNINVQLNYLNNTTENVIIGGETGSFTSRIYLGKVYYNIIWIVS